MNQVDDNVAGGMNDLEQQFDDMKWLNRCALTASEAPGLLSLITGIRDLLEERFEFARVGIMVGSLDPRFCLVHEMVTRDDMEAVPPGSLMVVKNTGLEWVFTRQRTHYAVDIQSHPEFLEDEELASVGVRSLIRIPLTFNSQVFGVMTLKSTKVDAFSDYQVNLYSRMGRHLSASIHSLKLIQDLRELSLRDPLTKAFNRHVLNELLEHENPVQYLRDLTHQDFGESDLVSAFFIDIDEFKRYNDVYGHLEGDNLLRRLVEILLHLIDEDGVVVRFGGDEFLAMLPGYGQDRLEEMREKMLGACRQGGPKGWPVSVSVGASCGTFHQLREIIDVADESMYRFKTTIKPG